jgi:hypothetical protein
MHLEINLEMSKVPNKFINLNINYLLNIKEYNIFHLNLISLKNLLYFCYIII